jgi:hypothetical protein
LGKRRGFPSFLLNPKGFPLKKIWENGGKKKKKFPEKILEKAGKPFFCPPPHNFGKLLKISPQKKIKNPPFF